MFRCVSQLFKRETDKHIADASYGKKDGVANLNMLHTEQFKKVV
jgi:hypothetical protein